MNRQTTLSAENQRNLVLCKYHTNDYPPQLVIDEEKPDQFTSRGYQDEILKMCIKQNTLIYLPTGSGKTFIAIMALKHFAKDLQSLISEGGKRSVFLTNTVVLAHQQAECITKATSLKVAVYTGDMNVDAWGRDRWYGEFDENQVIVATCQIVLDVVRHGYMKISDFNLMIFDECHHAQKEHPMLQLMARFAEYPNNQHPRIIGLTGMLTSPAVKPENVVDDLVRLESTFRSTIATAKGLKAYDDVLMYSTCPQETVINYETPLSKPIVEHITAKVNKIVEVISAWPADQTHERTNTYDLRNNKIANPLKKLQTILKDYVYQIHTLGLYGGSIAILAVMVELEIKKRECETTVLKALLRLLITYCEEILHIILTAMYDDNYEEQLMITDENDEFIEDRSTILTNSTPQVQKLLVFLKKFTEANVDRPMKGLIFVDRRHTAKVLCHIIKRYANAHPKLHIRPDFMVGNNSRIPDSIESMLTNKCNRKVLENFKSDETNIIIATSVLEEGIDLQECNLVISYDTPKSFRSYVQCKGRARMAQSEYVTFAPLSKFETLRAKIVEWKKINDILKDYLVKKAIDREPPLQENIDKAIEQKLNKKLKTQLGAVVDHLSAVSLVNRYCMSLPADQFTQSTVSWSKKEQTNGIVVSILLPIQSSVKNEILGEPMPSLKLAKRSAALNACIELYNSGELTDNLLPINKRKCLDRFKDVYFNHWSSSQFEKDKVNLAGTKKNYRIHEIQVPAELRCSIPRLRQKLFLYTITIEPGFSAVSSDNQFEIFHNLLMSNRSYGILTTKPLPRLGLMKFYQSFGALNCVINHTAEELTINDHNQLESLKRFHCVLFRDILDVWKSFFVYDLNDSIVVVPIKGKEIDWDIVDSFQNWPKLRARKKSERTGITYKPEDWLYKVVCPWYRADVDTRYVVTRISTNETPYSPFPNNSYENYVSYVTDKYTVEVVEREQFLIEVKGITSSLNRLQPGDGEDGRRLKVTTRGQELLIPELCHNFNYPGDLWLKAIVLPSVLHRLTYLLHAERIRVDINRYVGLNVTDYVPKPVIEKMPRDPISYAKPAITNSIVFPRPSEAPAKELKINDIVRFDPSVNCPFAENDEPIDLERHFDKAYPVEIDYYCQFINEKFENLSLGDGRDASKNLLSPRRYQKTQLALCDAPPDDKVHIKILDLNLTNFTEGVEQQDILAAITTAASSDVFHMERLEVIGDAFLKFGVSLYLIQKHPDWHEGFLTVIKGQIVSNRNLCYNAININLPGRIKVHNFNPKDDWQPPMVKVPDFLQIHMKDLNAPPQALYDLTVSTIELEQGEVSKDKLFDFFQQVSNNPHIRGAGSHESSMQNFLGMQRVADKTCADCVEAILGACIKSIGVERSFKLLEMFNIIPPKSHPNISDISEMLHVQLSSPRLRTNISDQNVDSFLTNYQELEGSIGYKFKDRAYLLQALTHPSYPTNRITGCYQQLEFLGDAVLDFLISAYIFERCPEMDPGKLTDLRSALVNNVTLACLCVRYNIHVFILSQNAALTESVARFVSFQLRFNNEVTDHVQLLMEEKEIDNKMAEYIDVPKTLGDIFEALIGGIFLDSGNDLMTTWRVIYRLMQKELDKFMADVPIQMVRKLYEFQNANPEFSDPVVNEDIVLVDLKFTCNGENLWVHGFGSNKENAKRAAAKLALHKLNM